MESPVRMVRAPKNVEALCGGISVRRSGGHTFPEVDRHAHDFHQVMWIDQAPAALRWRLEGKDPLEAESGSGAIIICPAYIAHQVAWESPFSALTLRISTTLLKRVADQIGKPGSALRPRFVDSDPFIETVANQLARDRTTGKSLFAQSLATAVSIHLLREYSVDDSLPGEVRPLSSAELKRVVRYIGRHLEQRIQLADLAKCVALSPHYFSRCFRVTTGKTPYQYLLTRRVVHACQLLTQGKEITESALLAGFSSQSHLHHHVRKMVGSTPGEIKRRSREEILEVLAPHLQMPGLTPGLEAVSPASPGEFP